MITYILLSAGQQICASGSAVEHLLAKERVAGSIPVSRSPGSFREEAPFSVYIKISFYPAEEPGIGIISNMSKNGTKQRAIFGIFLVRKLVDTDGYL